MVVDIAVRAKLYGSTQCCSRSTVGKTKCDKTGKVSCGRPWQFYCILVGLPDVLFRFRSRQPPFPPCMRNRYAYIRRGDAERKLEELAANIFHQPCARMNKLM
jgi:hypothetical protein